MIRFRLLNESELEDVERDGVPATIEVRYEGQTRRVVLEATDNSLGYTIWVPVEVEL